MIAVECGEIPDWLDGQEFYELMQSYRHSPLADQKNTIAAFEAVKKGIRDNYREDYRPPDDDWIDSRF